MQDETTVQAVQEGDVVTSSSERGSTGCSPGGA